MGIGMTFDLGFAALAGGKRRGSAIADRELLRKLGIRLVPFRPLADYCRLVANRVFRLPAEDEASDTPIRGATRPLDRTSPEHFSHTSLIRREGQFCPTLPEPVSESANSPEKSPKWTDKHRHLPVLSIFLLIVLAYLFALSLLAAGWPRW